MPILVNRPFLILDHVVNFRKHENSSFLEKFVIRNLKSILILGNL